jgi:hypothetical protein
LWSEGCQVDSKKGDEEGNCSKKIKNEPNFAFPFKVRIIKNIRLGHRRPSEALDERYEAMIVSWPQMSV